MADRFMAVDQYGNTYHGLEFPRRDLLRRFGIQHAEKMYRDTQDGKTRHVGYIIAGYWLEVFRVSIWKNAA